MLATSSHEALHLHHMQHPRCELELRDAHVSSAGGGRGRGRDEGDGTMSRLTHAQTSLPPLHAEWVPAVVLLDLLRWEGQCIRDPGKGSDSAERTGGRMTAEMW